MANTQAISNQFRSDILQDGFSLASGAKTLRAAIFLASATINATKLTYAGTIGSVSDTGEAAHGVGNYTAGGVVVTNAVSPTGANATAAGDTYYWTPSAAITWSNVTIASFDSILVFDGTTPFHALGVWNFGTQSITAGNITLNMPTNNSSTALVRLL